jgi:hypothetical protein
MGFAVSKSSESLGDVEQPNTATGLGHGTLPVRHPSRPVNPGPAPEPYLRLLLATRSGMIANIPSVRNAR